MGTSLSTSFWCTPLPHFPPEIWEICWHWCKQIDWYNLCTFLGMGASACVSRDTIVAPLPHFPPEIWEICWSWYDEVLWFSWFMFTGIYTSFGNVKYVPLPHFPPEIWKKIISMIDSKDSLKNISLVCKSMNSLVSSKMWASVHMKNPDGLLYIQHLPILDLNLRDSGCDNDALENVSNMRYLTKLNISENMYITSDGLSKLSSLTNLKYLNISADHYIIWSGQHSTPLTRGIEAIAQISLTELDISWCRLDNAYVSAVCGITTLTKLHMSGQRRITGNYEISSYVVSKLCNLKNLQYLSMSNCDGINSEILQGIARIRLTDLDISSCNIDDDCLTVVSQIRSLNNLCIRDNDTITSTGLSQLKNLLLSQLDISMCNIDDFCISTVCSITSLTSLSVSDNYRITSTGLSLLADLQGLQYLDIRSCRQIDSQHLHCISHITNIKHSMSYYYSLQLR